MTMGVDLFSQIQEDADKPVYKLVCRRGFGYVLVAQHLESTFDRGEVFITKHPTWEVMQERIKQAEALFRTKCEYENFEVDPTGGTVAKKPYKQSFFDHEFFRKAPAMAALRENSDPKPEHLRACLMELTRYVLEQSEYDAGHS